MDNGDFIELFESHQKLEQENKKLSHENSILLEQIRCLKKALYGSKKEKSVEPNQLKLPLGFFNEAEKAAENAHEEKEEEGVQIQPHTRKRGKRKPLPDDIPVEVKILDIPEEQKNPNDGTQLRLVGKDVSRKIEYSPATVKIIEYHRLRYEAESSTGETSSVVASHVPCIIPKGIATASLLAGIVINKYALGLPLYRQQEMFAWKNIELSRNSMARWVVMAAQACQAVYNVLQDRLMACPYVACDETHVQVLKEPGRAAEQRSYMWVRCNPSAQNKIVLFDYHPSRAGSVAKEIFEGYQGFLQVDGYAGYNALEKNNGIVRLGCAMHARRRFFKAVANGVSKDKSLGQVGVDFFKKLYQVEEALQNVTSQVRYEKRREQALPIWDEMLAWAKKNQPAVLAKSQIGQAFQYFLEEYPYLTRYLDDGQLLIDNGYAERAIRYFAIGRNNWMFSCTPAGANASSLLYSFVITARANNVNPYLALLEIFEKVPFAKTLEDYEKLADILLTSPPE